MKHFRLCNLAAWLLPSIEAAQFSLRLQQESKPIGPSPNLHPPDSVDQKAFSVQDSTSRRPKFPFKRNRNPYFFSTNISFGTPPQTFRAVVDINWAEPFVPSASCQDQVCKQLHLYNSTASSTYSENGTAAEIEYLPVKAEGYISTDALRIGEELILPSTTFVELKEYDDLFVTEEFSTFDTVLGFAIEKEWPDVNYGKSNRIPSLFRQMVDQEMLDRNVFSMEFPANQSEFGSIVLGGYDENRVHGELVAHPLFPENITRWSVRLDEVNYKISGTSSVTKTSINGAKGPWVTQLSSSPYISLPWDLFVSLRSQLYPKFSPCTGLPIADCDKLDELPELIFVLDGQEISVKGADYVEKSKPKRDEWSPPWTCEGPPEEQEDECHVLVGAIMEPWIFGADAMLGTSVLKKVYSVFDWDEKTVSFGKI